MPVSVKGKRGRPLGSKDKPRSTGAPQRGRPKKKNTLVANQSNTADSESGNVDVFVVRAT
jgi:hypothetical protein